MGIAQRLTDIKASLPQGVTLVAVSKFHPSDAIMEAYNAGQRVFGESRAQEVKIKQKELPKDIEWHFIGNLQSNKVKDIAPFVHTIHSIDSLKLLEEVNKQAAKQERIIRVLLEIHVAKEETKHGLTPDECKELLQNISPTDFLNIQITGLMCMATDTEETSIIQEEFHNMSVLFHELKESYFNNNPHFQTLSMGMSHDYQIAIQEGGNMVRIGTSIFGSR